MIDFASTRNGMDPQAAACARLLASVIALAITDASKPLSSEEKKQGRNIDGQALTALHFLFADGTVFPVYATLIGSSAESIRAALRGAADDFDHPITKPFPAISRRVLQARIRMGGFMGVVEVADEEEEVSDS